MELMIREFKQQGRTINIYNSSIVHEADSAFFLIREKYTRKLVIIFIYPQLKDNIARFQVEEDGQLATGGEIGYKICPCNHHNASLLRERFPFTSPQVMGLKPAIGTGDRIGLATPGHIRAVKEFGLFPVLAQQSIREMARSARSPEDVMDDVTWAVFQEGYRGGFAADADHLKTREDVDATFKAGFTMYTIDPSDYVDDESSRHDLGTLREKFSDLPWDGLKSNQTDCFRRYLHRKFELTSREGSLRLEFTKEKLLRAAVKYAHAIGHVAEMNRHLEKLFKEKKFDMEISIDETIEPTSPLEHFFIASELHRLGVHFQGIAPRFVGKFEKAIDYIGDLKEFESDLRNHVIIAKSSGYKLSVHSGSDKFSIYPILGRLARDIIHLKTAGTSYLETLRIVARHDPRLFREIVSSSLRYFEKDRSTYFVSASISVIPAPDKVSDKDLEKTYLEIPDARQILHVTFGSILTAREGDGSFQFRDRIKRVVFDHEEEYYQTISEHIGRHIKPLG